jgi:hypothetical protein
MIRRSSLWHTFDDGHRVRSMTMEPWTAVCQCGVRVSGATREIALEAHLEHRSKMRHPSHTSLKDT